MRNEVSTLLLLGMLTLRGGADPTTLKVERFELQGNTLISEAEMAPLLQPHLGRQLTLDEIRAVADELTRLHISKGFKLAHTYVPEQSFANGTVQLLVFEGKIGSLKVNGAEHRSPEMLSDYFSEIVSDGQYREDEVVRSLLLVNDLPDVKARIRLEKGQQKGTTDLVLEVEDRDPVGMWLSYNNYGSTSVGQNRAGLTAAHLDVSGVGDRLGVSTVVGFPTNTNVFVEAAYSRPLNTTGTRLNLGYTNSAFALGEQFEILDVRGNADIFRLSLDQALERSLTHRSDLSLALTSNSIRNTLLGAPFSRDDYLKGSLIYSGLWLDVNGQSWLSAALSQGFGTSPLNQASRQGAGGNFTHLHLDVLRIQNITPQFRWAGRALGQFSFNPLVAAEQFSLGGPYTVRGFPQAEMLADSAFVVSSEFRFSPLADDPQTLELLAFIDHGRGTLKQPQVGEVASRSLTGAGLGLRWNLDRDVQARLDLGFPISPGGNATGISPLFYAGVSTRLW
jgi:hemolysin activation/secretion protein